MQISCEGGEKLKLSGIEIIVARVTNVFKLVCFMLCWNMKK